MTDERNKPDPLPRRAAKIQEYLVANLYFWGFLIVLALVSFFACGAVWDEAYRAVLEFLFLLMGGGYTLVSVLDYLYDDTAGSSFPEVKK